MSDLTPQQVVDLEQRLAAHYGEPVLPVSRYCNALRTYANAAKDSADQGAREAAQGLLRAQLPIAKSNLLWRLIYLGHPLRTEPCPIHKGRWSGYGDCACNLGGTFSDMTGWLATPESPGGDSERSQSLIRAVTLTVELDDDEPWAQRCNCDRPEKHMTGCPKFAGWGR